MKLYKKLATKPNSCTVTNLFREYLDEDKIKEVWLDLFLYTGQTAVNVFLLTFQYSDGKVVQVRVYPHFLEKFRFEYASIEVKMSDEEKETFLIELRSILKQKIAE